MIKRMNNETDPFSQLVRDKLEGHELPVDEGCWQQIEARMHEGTRKAFPLWGWLSGLAVGAAAVVLLFLLPPFRPSTMPDRVAEQQDQLPVAMDSVGGPLARPLGQEVRPAPLAQSASRPAAARCGSNGFVAQHRSDETPRPDMFRPNEQVSVKESAAADTTGTPVRKEYAESVRKENRSVDLPDDFRLDEPPAMPDRRRNTGWQLAASVSGGGGTQSQQTSLLAYAPRTSPYLETSEGSQAPVATPVHTAPETDAPKAGYLRSIDAGDYSHVTHLPPISVGLRVRKDIGKHFALESGLTYTYLHSMFDDKQIIQREAALSMHYLGIPLNAVVYIVNHPKWNVYFLAGGMMEKGLQATYAETVRVPNSEPETKVETGKIAGLQWSLNASFGIGYNFHKNVSIYFEPNVAYYLKNNQPLSVRTESPLIVGLNAGIRFRIK